MEHLLLDLKNVAYSANDVQRRRDEQTKEWLQSRRPEVSQGNTKRRRTNHGAREFGAQVETSNGERSMQAVRLRCRNPLRLYALIRNPAHRDTHKKHNIR